MNHAYLTSILDYDPDTGIFTWSTPRPKIRVGQKAGCLHKGKKYVYIEIDGKGYAAHRLAWFYVTGKMPIDQIDHINRNRSDNRFENLREANNKFNQANRKTTSKYGLKGITYHKWLTENPWEAKIRVDKKDIYLGCYPTKEEAHKAYCIAAEKYFGEFASH